MRKLVVIFILCFAFGLYGGIANAADPLYKCSNLNEPGSLIVFPHIDNIGANSTVIEIANLSDYDVWLWCYFISELPTHTKKNFKIHITQKEPFWWETSRAYNRQDISGQLTQIQSFDEHKGFMFCWAVDNEKNQFEITHNYLKGDAVFYNQTNGRAFQYNAITHQRLVYDACQQLDGLEDYYCGPDSRSDRVLCLNGADVAPSQINPACLAKEYTAGPTAINFEGFAEDFQGIGGTLAVANLDIDFINSVQPAFDINIECWNQNELPFSRHLGFPPRSYVQYDLTNDLQLSLAEVFTPKFQCSTSSTRPLWAVFFEHTGGLAFGTNVFQNKYYCYPTAVVLPNVTEE